MVFDQCQAMLNLAFTGPEKLQECPEALALPSTARPVEETQSSERSHRVSNPPGFEPLLFCLLCCYRIESAIDGKPRATKKHREIFLVTRNCDNRSQFVLKRCCSRQHK